MKYRVTDGDRVYPKPRKRLKKLLKGLLYILAGIGAGLVLALAMLKFEQLDKAIQIPLILALSMPYLLSGVRGRKSGRKKEI